MVGKYFRNELIDNIAEADGTKIRHSFRVTYFRNQGDISFVELQYGYVMVEDIQDHISNVVANNTPMFLKKHNGHTIQSKGLIRMDLFQNNYHFISSEFPYQAFIHFICYLRRNSISYFLNPSWVGGAVYVIKVRYSSLGNAFFIITPSTFLIPNAHKSILFSPFRCLCMEKLSIFVILFKLVGFCPLPLIHFLIIKKIIKLSPQFVNFQAQILIFLAHGQGIQTISFILYLLQDLFIYC